MEINALQVHENPNGPYETPENAAEAICAGIRVLTHHNETVFPQVTVSTISFSGSFVVSWVYCGLSVENHPW